MIRSGIRSVIARLAVLAALFGSGLLGGAILPTAVNAQQASRMLCESINYQTKFCPQPGLTVAFVVQVLGGQCVAGQQWGWGPRGITVNNGCRAVFGYRTSGSSNGGVYTPPPPANGGGYGRPILCQSLNFQPARCAMDTSGGVTIGMITNQPCRQGQTWGWDRGGVWVNGNCRAWFKAGGGGNPGIGNGAGYAGANPGIGNGASMGGQTIDCSSWQYQPARCPANTRNGVQMVTVIAGECVRNRSWGWDETAIWVSNGCRARFRTN